MLIAEMDRVFAVVRAVIAVDGEALVNALTNRPSWFEIVNEILPEKSGGRMRGLVTIRELPGAAGVMSL